MSFENLIIALTEALAANTAALTANAGAANTAALTANAGAAPTAEAEKPATKPKADAKPKAEAKPKFSVEQASSLLLELKEAHGLPEAKAILVENGVAGKMSEMTPAQAPAIYEAAKARLEELANASAGNDEDDGI